MLIADGYSGFSCLYFLQQQLEYAKQINNDGRLERSFEYIMLTHKQYLYIFKIVMIIISNKINR